ncbi:MULTISPECIES: CU044_2847 family protein [unclassified Microcoleus]|jgi:hypothetical protein|uniref:CU044_2847 family protein n=1 Tax=unclassified Microcoleus TaxID=2642155 RepID=UPI001D865E24|nr:MULTISPECIES: CU044_2847 family protein [unclassified Microcoleus]MCC3457475.1 hypothetical protein [Microcoleus sp. PH2017_08_TRC_O_A]MCC3588087.1 hypothetical protein [Microcoleus sp. PH2017_30_WIL_O_A]
MSFSDPTPIRPEQTVQIPVLLPNGATAKIEIARIGGRQDVGFSVKPLIEISEAIEGIVQAVAIPIQKVKPQKATIKFGIELAMESGQLAAVIVKGSGKANLEITLEWEQPPTAKS